MEVIFSIRSVESIRSVSQFLCHDTSLSSISPKGHVSSRIGSRKFCTALNSTHNIFRGQSLMRCQEIPSWLEVTAAPRPRLVGCLPGMMEFALKLLFRADKEWHTKVLLEIWGSLLLGDPFPYSETGSVSSGRCSGYCRNPKAKVARVHDNLALMLVPISGHALHSVRISVKNIHIPPQKSLL